MRIGQLLARKINTNTWLPRFPAATVVPDFRNNEILALSSPRACDRVLLGLMALVTETMATISAPVDIGILIVIPGNDPLRVAGEGEKLLTAFASNPPVAGDAEMIRFHFERSEALMTANSYESSFKIVYHQGERYVGSAKFTFAAGTLNTGSGPDVVVGLNTVVYNTETWTPNLTVWAQDTEDRKAPEFSLVEVSEAWKKVFGRKPIIALDFDGTLAPNVFPDTGPISADVARVLDQIYPPCELMLFTCREGKWLEDAKAALAGVLPEGTRFAVNQNDPSHNLPWTTGRKPFYDLLWDDRNVGGLPETEYVPDIILEDLIRLLDDHCAKHKIPNPLKDEN